MNMITITISVPEIIRVTSREADCDVKVASLPESIRNAIFEYGVTQKLADAASGAGKPENWTEDEAKLDNQQSGRGASNPAATAATLRMMGKARDLLVSGEWSQRGAGGASDPLEPFIRSLIRTALKEKRADILGPDVAKKLATFKAIKENDRRNEYLDKQLAGLSDDWKGKLANAATALHKAAEARKAEDRALFASL